MGCGSARVGTEKHRLARSVEVSHRDTSRSSPPSRCPGERHLVVTGSLDVCPCDPRSSCFPYATLVSFVSTDPPNLEYPDTLLAAAHKRNVLSMLLRLIKMQHLQHRCPERHSSPYSKKKTRTVRMFNILPTCLHALDDACTNLPSQPYRYCYSPLGVPSACRLSPFLDLRVGVCPRSDVGLEPRSHNNDLHSQPFGCSVTPA